jgi:hypothetical protein
VKITAIRPYSGPSNSDGTVDVYDITVDYTNRYTVCGVVVSNSKRISLLDTNALLSHGATETLNDAGSVRGQENTQWWLQTMNGLTPTEPRVPHTYLKFVDSLKASGINVVPKGGQLQVMALTDKDLDRMAGDRRIVSGDTVRFDKGLKPVTGGLFDPKLTGGHGGKRWSAIDLHEPLPNPVMEEPIRRLLGLTQKKFEAVISGEEKLAEYGSGSSAIKKALEDINVERDIILTRAKVGASRGQKRDDANRRLDYLKSLQRTGLQPADWIMSKAPVLPPAFRPVSVMGSSGTPLVSDSNYLYKELLEANDILKEMKGHVGEDGVGNERLAVYNAFKAVTGLGEPITPKSKEKKLKGILAGVFGSSPKYGCYDDETEILSENGWIKFADLADGVRVATLDGNTGAFEWQTPTGVFHWDYTGELFWFGTRRGLDCVVTPNHRNWVRNRRKSNDKYDEDIESGWEIERAYVTAANQGRKWFRTAASHWSGHRFRPAFLPRTCKLVDFAAFVGWWAAEGWLGDRKGDCVQLCQAAHQTAKCKEISRLVVATGLPFSVGLYHKENSKGRTTVWQWSIRSASLAAWLTKHVGRGAGGKQLSDRVRDWDSPFLLSFFTAYLNGDGTRRYLPRQNNGGVTHKNHTDVLNGHQNSHTISERLAGDLQEIACKLGVTARLRWCPPQNERCQPLCRVNLSGSRFVVMEGKDNHKIINYNGQVHCVSVPNGIVYVRRNGKPFFSGNTVQRKLISSTVDNVGRAVISPNPEYDMDTVGLPEDKAFDVYEKFVVRRLRRAGMPVTRALQEVKDRSKIARNMLVEEMDKRPVFINRAPVLHRFGIMAFRPQLVKSDTMQISPLVTKGFGADFDGDAMQFHVPSTDEAVKEAYERMMPSKNLISPADFKSPVHSLSQEYLGGLYRLSKPRESKRKRTFRSVKDAVAAHARGEIGYDDKVHVLQDR